MAEPNLDQYRAQAMQKLQQNISNANRMRNELDRTTGAPAQVRALVGSAQTQRDKLATLKKFYPDAQPDPVDPENFLFTNPETGKLTEYNPSGLDAGDSPSLVREIGGQLGGAAAGAAYGSRAGPPGAFAGGVLGALGGDEAVTLGARALGMEDTRTGLERAGDAASLAGAEAVGHGLGAGLTRAVSAGGKALFRGGETGRRGVQSSIYDAAQYGASPSVAQATQKAYLDSFESILSKTPGGAGKIRTVVKNTSEKVARALEEKVQNLTRMGEVDPEKAGRTLIQGIAGTGKPGKGFIDRFNQTKSALYAKADQLIPDATLVTPLNTRAMLNELGDVVPSLPELNDWLVSSGIRGLRGAFPAQGEVPYEVLRRMRSAVGSKLSNFDLVSDIPRADWKRLYGALTEDLKQAAVNAGPAAVKATSRADTFYRSGIKRIDEVLEPLINKKVPELVAAALDRSITKGGSTIRPVMRSLEPEERAIVAGSIVRRLGSARAGQQDAAGEVFSFETFLTNWNKLDPKAKDALFDWPGMKGMKEDLDALSRWSDRVRESSQAFNNPSGTAGASAGITLGLMGGGSGIAGALTGSTAMLTLPAVFAIGVLGAHASARLMTSKGFVRWLAQSTKVKPNGWGVHLGRLGGIAANADPQTQDAIHQFINVFDQAGPNGN